MLPAPRDTRDADGCGVGELLAEALRHGDPHRLQHFLARAVWDHDAVRDRAARWIAHQLADDQAVLVVDETGDEKSPRTQPTPRASTAACWAPRTRAAPATTSSTSPPTRPASPRLDRKYVREEALQARELTETLAIFDDAGVDGAFVQTFIQPLNAYNADPRFDFDMASYSLVKSYGTRIGGLAAQFPGIPLDLTPSGTS
jgi:DDE superfamily endonuclease